MQTFLIKCNQVFRTVGCVTAYGKQNRQSDTEQVHQKPSATTGKLSAVACPRFDQIVEGLSGAISANSITMTVQRIRA